MDVSGYADSVLVEARNAVQKYFMVKSEKNKKEKDELILDYLNRVNL